jgi:hypothetical protein
MTNARKHRRRRVETDPLARSLRHNKRNAPLVRRRQAGVSRPVGQDHVTLALASLAIGPVAVVADEALGSLRRALLGLRPFANQEIIARKDHPRVARAIRFRRRRKAPSPLT